MRPLRALLIYTLVVFVGGALLAPWLYQLVYALAPASHLAQNPFHRYVDRCLLGLALIGIWPLLRALGATSWRDVGFVKPCGQCKRLGAGFVLGFGSLACVAAIVLAAHGRQINPNLTAGRVCKGLASAAGTAIVVAVLEELLFRGGIFGALRKVWNWRTALVVSSMIYAIVHFQKAELTGPVTWSSGLELLPHMLAGYGNLQSMICSFLSLTLAGISLGFAYQKTGNLYFSIGLHAGWIFWLKFYGLVTNSVAEGSPWLWGTDRMIDGWLALFVLAGAFLVLIRLMGKPGKTEP
jgi:membrane protease YdiL (CAAX protease family)